MSNQEVQNVVIPLQDEMINRGGSNFKYLQAVVIPLQNEMINRVPVANALINKQQPHVLDGKKTSKSACTRSQM